MNALNNLSRRAGGGFVSPVDITGYLGETALQLGLSATLQSLEDHGFIEHMLLPDGTGGDRPTETGLAHFNLQAR